MSQLRCATSPMLMVFLFLTVFSSSMADRFCRQASLRLAAKGVHLTANVISSHNVESSIDCSHQCLQETTCVAFNYRSARKSDEPNCQLTNTTEGFKESDVNNNDGDWTFYKVLDVPSPHCSNNRCKNGGECVPNPCQTKGFTCKCGAKYKGKLCETKKVGKSCKELLEFSSTAQDGTYEIETNTTIDLILTKVYCQMKSLPGCSGGGWTMVMKINGTKNTFNYSSTYWSDKQSYNLAGGLSAFDDQETKLPTYWSTSFNELCVGMKVGNDLNFVNISYPASSLYSLIANGNYLPTNIGRQQWKSLISDSSLQYDCNKEGFNTRSGGVFTLRMGILGNEYNSCNGADSFLGFGGPVTDIIREGLLLFNTAGNFASYSPDNGKKNTHAMGYILVH